MYPSLLFLGILRHTDLDVPKLFWRFLGAQIWMYLTSLDILRRTDLDAPSMFLKFLRQTDLDVPDYFGNS